MKKLNYYKPQIDGLRALAVLSVIFYHLDLELFGTKIFEGGFIGVDIFFVISGYLITRIISNDLDQGKFKFSTFYKRRVRRILPALVLVKIITIPFFIYFYLPLELKNISLQILYSLGFLSNFYFWKLEKAYSLEGLDSPFLHTWSLSVEEQFYIIFPLTLVLLKRKFAAYLIPIFIILIIGNLFVSNFLSKHFPTFSFYMIIGRLWEFFLGSITFLVEKKNYNKKIDTSLSLFFSIIGLLLILSSLFFFKQSWSHPSLVTLLPLMGTILVLYFCDKRNFISSFLSFRPLVGIGLLSYSLYLWHFPILSLMNLASTNKIINFFEVKFLLITFFMSTVSYFIVEKKLRKKSTKFRNVFFFVTGISILILVTNFIIVKNNGIILKKNELLDNIKKVTTVDEKCKFNKSVNNFINDLKFYEQISYCKSKYGKAVLIVGDSHGRDMFNIFAKFSNQQFIIGLNQGGCRPGLKDCIYQNALKFIKNNKNLIQKLIFTHRGAFFLTEKFEKHNNSKWRLPVDEAQFNKTINYVEKLNKIYPLIFLGPHIEPGIVLNSIAIDDLVNKKLEKEYSHNINFDMEEVDKILEDKLKSLNIEYISKIKLIDFNFYNDFVVDGKLTFYDTDHFTDKGHEYFGKKILKHEKLNF